MESGQPNLQEVENLYLLLSNHFNKGNVPAVQELLENQVNKYKPSSYLQNLTVDNLVNRFIQVPQDNKQNIKIKYKYAQILLLFTDIQVFTDQLSQSFIKVVQRSIEEGHDNQIDDIIMTIMSKLYLNNNTYHQLLIDNLQLIGAAIIQMIEHDETRISQKAIKAFEQMVRALYNHDPQLFHSSSEMLVALLEKGLENQNTVIQMRYFEIACKLAKINEDVSKTMENPIGKVFEHFFETDELTQITIMDFVTEFTKCQWTASILMKWQFLEKLLAKFKGKDDLYGFVSSNLIQLGAFIYSQSPEVFKAIEDPNFIWFFYNYINSSNPKDQEVACTCIYFFLKRKQTLHQFFVNDLEMIKRWISCGRSTTGDTKKAFFVSLAELFKLKNPEDEEKYNEIIRRIWSNLSSPQIFPDFGNENQSVDWLIKFTDVPYEEQEKVGIKVIKNLINWEWGMRALYANSNAVSYLLNRGKKSKEITELKYTIAQKTLQSKYFLKSNQVIDPVIGEQLEVYYSQGVYGTEGGPSFVPEYASKSA